jgi:hypothetical protein
VTALKIAPVGGLSKPEAEGGWSAVRRISRNSKQTKYFKNPLGRINERVETLKEGGDLPPERGGDDMITEKAVVSRITEKALVSRINRKLAHDGEYLRKNRSLRWQTDLGDWYVVNDRNCLVAAHVDVVKLGQELGVLREFEVVSEEEGE